MGGADERIPTEGPGPRVRFRMRDVFVPEPERVRDSVNGDWEVIGVLVALSDSGDRPGEFGIVRVADGINLVVPVTALTEVRD
jgi:hypothetical protein